MTKPTLLCLLALATSGTASAAGIDFETKVRPILEMQCLKCHSRGKYKGGFSLETREAVLKGGENGPGAVLGKSGDSLLIHLVEGREEGRRMPDKGKPLTAEQITTLKTWIDEGLSWPEGLSFGFRRATLAPRRPEVPPAPAGSGLSNPVDRFVARYMAENGISADWKATDDRRFARRVHLDLVGVIPTPDQLSKFEADQSPSRVENLVKGLLADRRAYADHWLTFWNDALRNAYRGTGFIDNGRKSITEWLYKSLYDNKPYDRFVKELIKPVPGSEGFTKGIVWRGVVNASQIPPVQAAQNVSQVFLGTNLKCASCHDSFVNHWKLTDAYGLAAVFSEGPLEVNRCDKPTGQTSKVAFIYPELGSIDAKSPRLERMGRLADLVVSRENGRFSRTVVNRLWASLMGRGLVEPLDDLDQAPWSQDLLDWLAEDFVAHGYDMKHTLALIATSRTYRLPSVGTGAPSDKVAYRFQGPLTRRMTAEQLADSISTLTGVWPEATAAMLKIDGRGQGGQLTAVRAAALEEIRAKESPKAAAPSIQARWIWSNPGAAADTGGRILIRKSITLEQVPEKAVLAGTCDNELVFYVNGRKVAESDEWSKPVSVDVTKFLRKGENVIAAEAVNWPDPQSKKGKNIVGPNPAGFIAWIGGFENGKGVWGFGSDGTWLWAKSAKAGWKDRGFKTDDWKHSAELEGADARYRVNLADAVSGSGAGLTDSTPIRAALVFDDPLLSALGRPNREQVVTRRDPTATTLQALEMTNGATLDSKLKQAATELIAREGTDPSKLTTRMFIAAFGRDPNAVERSAALELLGSPATSAGVQDLLWTLTMLPEFQLIR